MCGGIEHILTVPRGTRYLTDTAVGGTACTAYTAVYSSAVLSSPSLWYEFWRRVVLPVRPLPKGGSRGVVFAAAVQQHSIRVQQSRVVRCPGQETEQEQLAGHGCGLSSSPSGAPLAGSSSSVAGASLAPAGKNHRFGLAVSNESKPGTSFVLPKKTKKTTGHLRPL